MQRACGFIPTRRPDCAGPMHCVRHKIPDVFGTRLHPHGKLSTIIDQIAYSHHVYFNCSISGARFNVISSGGSPFYKFVVQQIKKAGPRTDSAAKVEPTCPSRRPSRRPYPLSASGLAGGWRASRAPKPTHFVRCQRARDPRRDDALRDASRHLTGGNVFGWTQYRLSRVTGGRCN